jgi:hypothetical protein
LRERREKREAHLDSVVFVGDTEDESPADVNAV